MNTTIVRSIFVLITVITLGSCTPVLTELWINKDGSGQVESTMDLGEMIGLVEGMMTEEGEEKTQMDSTKEQTKMDSTFCMYDQMPDSVRHLAHYPELWKKFFMRMQMDEAKKLGLLTMTIAYNSMDEARHLIADMDRVFDGDNGGPLEPGESLSEIFVKHEQDLKQGIIRLESYDLVSDMEEEMGEDLDSLRDSIQNNLMEPAAMELLEMMFGRDLLTVVYAPGKIEFTSDPNAKIEGNKVIFTDNLLEEINSGVVNRKRERIIKFETK